MLIVSVHKCDVIKQRHNMIREIRNRCDAGYFIHKLINILLLLPIIVSI